MAVGPHTGEARGESELFECGAVAEGSHPLGGKRGRPRDTAREERRLPSFSLKLPRSRGRGKYAGRGGGRAEEGENNGGPGGPGSPN